jgi:flagellar hook-basal body complex protein FliE
MPAANIANAVSAYLNAGRMSVPGGNEAASGTGQSFGDILKSAADSVVDTMQKGEQASLAAATGKADLASVTEAVNNAEIAVQTVVAIRDRVVSAYQDIMRMPI